MCSGQPIKLFSLLGAKEQGIEEIRSLVYCCHGEERCPFVGDDIYLLGQHRRIGNLEVYSGSRRGQKEKAA